MIHFKMPTPTLQLLVALSLIAIASGAKPVFKTDTTDKVTWRFKSRPKLDVSKIILEWEPFNMLEDTADVDSDGGLGVNIKSGDGEFIPVTVPPRVPPMVIVATHSRDYRHPQKQA